MGEALGFNRLTATELRLESAAVTRIDARLSLATEAEIVRVTAELPLLQSGTSSQATVVNRNLLERIPLQLTGTNRYITSFIPLDLRVNGGSGNFRLVIAGGRQHTNEVLVDGVTNTYRASGNTPFSVRPSVTSVSAFRVEGADVTRRGEGTLKLGGPLVAPGLYNGRRQRRPHRASAHLPVPGHAELDCRAALDKVRHPLRPPAGQHAGSGEQERHLHVRAVRLGPERRRQQRARLRPAGIAVTGS